jgi:autotransporter passenger strand-loop-strand repeat protein
VNSGWSVTVWGTANKFTINGGKMEVLLGGKVYDTTVNSNGFLDLDCSWYGGSGSAHRTTVNPGGRVTVGYAGLVNSFTLNSGGTMHLSAGAKATGLITIENGAYFYADPDTIFNFDLSGLSPDNSAPVNGLSFVQGAPTFTLTVTGTLDEGTYKVAEGAAGFDKTITVVNTSGRALGTVAVADGTRSIAGRDYTLTLTDGSLCITLGTRPEGFDLTNDLNKTYDIPAGTVINGMNIIKGGKLNVYGATSETTVSSGGSLIVFDGGSANEATVSRYGYMYVSSGGSATGATINSAGGMYVSSGGSATDTTVNWRGGLYVRKDASADGVTVNALGGLFVSAGGTATNVRENGGNVWMEDGVTVTFIKNAFSGIAVDQAKCTVHSGTTATDITINTNGDLCVYDNGSAISATVNAEGEICVFSGGSMNSATVNRCGNLYVSAGGTATQIVENGGWVEADPDATVTFVPNVLSGIVFDKSLDGATIHSGTTGIDLTFNKGNGLTVFSGGFVKNITLGYDIGLGVSSGGKVTGKMTFDAGARVTAYDGGILDFDLRETAADADALLNNLSVVKGDPTFTLTVTGSEAYGTYKLAESATGFDKTITVVNTLGETLGTLTVAGGRKLIDGRKYMLNLDESSGLSVTISDRIDLTGDLDSEFHLESDMVGSGVNVLSGGALYISSGAEADHVTVNFGGYIQFWDASGTMTNIKENGGYANTHPDATVTFLPNSFGGYTYSGNSMASIHSGTIGSGLTVCSDGGINVFSGGVAQNVTAGSRGEVSIRSGGTVDGITISSGGRLEVLSGGKVTGKLTLYDRGVFSTELGSILDFDLTRAAPGEDVLVNDLSGRQIMSSLTLTVDGTEAMGDYNLVGHVSYYSFETRTITVVNTLGETLGTLTVAEGTKTIGSRDYTLTIDSDKFGVTISDRVDLTGDLSGEFELDEGKVGSSVNILNGGKLRVSDGGSAEIITVNPGGTLYVSDGGTATKILENGGYVYVLDGAVVTFVPNTIDDLSLNNTGATVHSGTTAVGVIANSGGYLSVLSGGLANGTVVNPGGKLYVSSGALVANILENGGYVYAYNGAELSFAPNTISDLLLDGTSATIHSGTTATNVTVNPGGWIQISSGGTATEIKENGGYVYVLDGAVVTFTPNTFSGLVLSDRDSATVHSGTTACGGTVNSGGNLYVSSGGTATEIKENGGYVNVDKKADVTFAPNIISGLLLSKASATVHSGTTMTDAQIIQKGRVSIFSGGLANSVIVSSGGRLFVTGGKLTGKTTIETGAEVTVGTGSILDFDLTQTAADADVLVNDLSFFRGYASYTLTVSGREATGSYKLAGNVAEFNEVITVVSTAGEELGFFHIGDGGDTLSTAFADYTLKLTDDVLSVDVESKVAADTTAPVVSNVAADITAPTKNSVTVTADFSDDVALKSSLYRLEGESDWSAYPEGGVVVDRSTTVYFMAVDSSDNESKVVSYDVTNIDTVAPVITLSGDNQTPLRASTLTASTDDGSPIYYRIGDSGEWTEYREPITVTDNATYNFLSADAAGNEGSNFLTFDNIIQTPISDVAPQTQTWEQAGEAAQYIVEYSTDNFEHVIQVTVNTNSLDSFQMPAGNYQMRVKADGVEEWTVATPFVASEAADNEPKLIRSVADGNADVFFVNAVGTWESGYVARHVGSTDDDTWGGTDESATLFGKNKLADIIEGSTDANVLLMTDDINGDALFVDDIFSASPSKLGLSQSRIARIDEIRAGFGNDIVDMTSQRFEYTGDGLTIRGGEGDDTIWANKGNNFLFGDAGNDRIVGASGNDVIAGGIGNDRMHGGGGDDVFTFCDNWGTDEVEQLAGGSVTLWFASGDESKWNNDTLTYTDVDNSVRVTGVATVTLKFGGAGDDAAMFASLSDAGAFKEFTSQKIFEENKGLLA